MIVVTGANGFLGKSLLNHLRNIGAQCCGVSTSVCNLSQNVIKLKGYDDPDFLALLVNAKVLVHLAGSVPDKNKHQKDKSYYKTGNYDLTKLIASHAYNSGIRKFIYLSTAQIYGNSSEVNKPFTLNSIYRPCNDYSLSKLEAELFLKDKLNDTHIQTIILRPTIIYGVGVKGLFKKIIDKAQKKKIVFVPKVDFKRSVLSVDNFNSVILHIVNSNKNLSGEYILSDLFDYKLYELFLHAYHKNVERVIKVNVPDGLIKYIKQANIISGNSFGKIFENFQVDASESFSKLKYNSFYDYKNEIKKILK